MSFFASASSVVYVVCQVCVRWRLNGWDGGRSSLSSGIGGGCDEARRSEGAGEVFAESEFSLDEVGRLMRGLGSLGGLPQDEAAGDRSCTGRGEMGTFQMMASSGSSSSPSSSHSASRSFAVFLAVVCHDCLLAFMGVLEGEISWVRELLRERVRGAEVNDLCEFAGEGERDRRPGAARLETLLSIGAEGDVNPRLN